MEPIAVIYSYEAVACFVTGNLSLFVGICYHLWARLRMSVLLAFSAMGWFLLGIHLNTPPAKTLEIPTGRQVAGYWYEHTRIGSILHVVVEDKVLSVLGDSRRPFKVVDSQGNPVPLN